MYCPYAPLGTARIEQRGLRYMLVYRIGLDPRVMVLLGHFHTDAPAVRAAKRILREIRHRGAASRFDLDETPRRVTY